MTVCGTGSCERRPRPLYEALDLHGAPCTREARVIHELPTVQERREALCEALPVISALLQMSPAGGLPFGAPIAAAFMSDTVAKKHPMKALLLTKGDSLSLDFCPSFMGERSVHSRE